MRGLTPPQPRNLWVAGPSFPPTVRIRPEAVSLPRWVRSHPLEVMVVVGVLLDWLPRLLTGSEYLSGTKLLILPAIAVDMVLRARLYLRLRGTIGFSLVVSLLLGLGVAVGTVEWPRMMGVLPSLAIALFVLRLRSRQDMLAILRLATVLSLAVPVVIILNSLGLVSAVDPVELPGGLSRYRGGTNWSSIGLYLILPAAFLGGSLFPTGGRPGQKLRRTLMSMPLVGLVVVAALLTGQRAAVLCVAACACLSFLSGIVAGRASVLIPTLALALSVPLFFPGSRGGLDTATGAFQTRMEGALNRDEASAEGRIDMYRMLVRDLGQHPLFVSPGEGGMYETLGFGPHFLVGEAYYNGGLGLFLLVVALFLRLYHRGYSVFLRVKMPLNAGVLSWITGILLATAFHPAMNLRILALSLSVAWVMTKQSPSVRLRPSQAGRGDALGAARRVSWG